MAWGVLMFCPTHTVNDKQQWQATMTSWFELRLGSSKNRSTLLNSVRIFLYSTYLTVSTYIMNRIDDNHQRDNYLWALPVLRSDAVKFVIAAAFSSSSVPQTRVRSWDGSSSFVRRKVLQAEGSARNREKTDSNTNHSENSKSSTPVTNQKNVNLKNHWKIVRIVRRLDWGVMLIFFKDID